METLMSNIVKVANELDKAGYSKEASVLDDILRKVVANRVDQSVPYGQMLNIPNPSGRSVATGPSQGSDVSFYYDEIIQANNALQQIQSRLTSAQPQQKKVLQNQYKIIQKMISDMNRAGTKKVSGLTGNLAADYKTYKQFEQDAAAVGF